MHSRTSGMTSISAQGRTPLLWNVYSGAPSWVDWGTVSERLIGKKQYWVGKAWKLCGIYDICGRKGGIESRIDLGQTHPEMQMWQSRSHPEEVLGAKNSLTESHIEERWPAPNACPSLGMDGKSGASVQTLHRSKNCCRWPLSADGLLLPTARNLVHGYVMYFYPFPHEYTCCFHSFVVVVLAGNIATNTFVQCICTVYLYKILYLAHYLCILCW